MTEMYPASFDYQRADSVEEALSLLASANGQDAQLLAGGHGLIPDMKSQEATPDLLIDIGDIDALQSIECDEAADSVSIGALTTHAELASSDILAESVPVLKQAAAQVADLQIRNKGTIGGNLAEADVEADLPAAILALDGTIHAEGPAGSRTIPVGEFFQGEGETALAPDELLTSIAVPTIDTGAYVRKTHPARGYAMVGVAVTLEIADTEIEDASIAAVGVQDRPIRLTSVEEALVGLTTTELTEQTDPILSETVQVASYDLEDDHAYGDLHASADFRADLLPTYAERAILAAIEGGEHR